ncbi:MAG TPA: hypothetical protein VGM31_13960 [Puia sp.]|jgi:hypothetical protein
MFIVDVQPVVASIPGNAQYGTQLPPEKMTLTIHGGGWSGKLMLTRLDGVRTNNELHVTELDGYLFLGRAQ